MKAALALAAILLFGDANADRSPYDYDPKEAAAYLKAMHDKIHPIFVGREIAAMDKQPKDAPWNDRDAYAVVLITIDSAGKVTDVNVVKGTGVPELNQAIRRSITDASPFPKPPARILSRDDKARVRWQFHRDPTKECKPTKAWPLIVEPG